ncbi:MAG: hypothetical protein LBD07_02730 [Spirochaetaceae bacterium]|jgi:hypothetical protein|nr:hypothetical protein [Spirochaetaceae bacterium]
MKEKIKLLSAIGVIAFFPILAGCDNFSNDGDSTTTDLYRSVEDVLLTKPPALSRYDVPEKKSTGDSNLIIGVGYDITREYASINGIRHSVLDYKKLTADNLIANATQVLPPTVYESISGNNANKYQESLSESLNIQGSGSWGPATFSAQVKHNFGNGRINFTNYSFATARLELPSKILKVTLPVPNLVRDAKYLSQDFIEDLKKNTPEELVANYGTHVMLGGIWGARFDYSMSGRSTQKGSATNLATQLMAKLSLNFSSGKGGTITGDYQYNKQITDYIDEDSIFEKILIEGGDEKKRALLSVNHTEENFNDWLHSINEDTQYWTNYYGGLIELPMFVTDNQKRAEVQAYLNEYYKTYGISPDQTERKPIGDSYFSASFSEKTGNANRIGGGDSNINSKDNRNTRWWLTVSFSRKSDTSVNMHVKYVIEEVAKNHTKLCWEGDKTVNLPGIPTGKKLLVDEAHPLPRYSGSGVIGGKHYDWVSVSVPGLTNTRIIIDGPKGTSASKMDVRFDAENAPFFYQ